MVRFIIETIEKLNTIGKNVYIPIWLDLLLLLLLYSSYSFLCLHSNMVRFIILAIMRAGIFFQMFTFQYGQIYYVSNVIIKSFSVQSLHSNMVRFIINIEISEWSGLPVFTFQYGQIYYMKYVKRYRIKYQVYIPIWLDLLSIKDFCLKNSGGRLHSNMVRFIIKIF